MQKFSLADFKKVASDEHSTTLQHPKGHLITVAHKALSQKMKQDLDKLPHYAVGGPAEMQDEGGGDEESPVENTPVSSMPDAGSIPEEDTNVFGTPQPNQPMSQAQAMPDQTTQGIDNQPANPAANAQAQTQQPNTQQPGLPGSAQLGALQQEQNAILEGGKAQAAQAKAEADVAAQNVADQQKNLIDYQTQKSAIDQQVQHATEDYNNQHIDPQHYWGNLSTMGKVSTVIGLILGGIGSGATGQKNAALEALNNNIENDINTQKIELGKKDNILGANLRQYGNLQMATNATRAMQLDIARNKLEQAAMSTNDPIVQARAKQAAAQIGVQIGGLTDQMTMMRMQQQQLTNGSADPARLVAQMVPKEHQKEAFHEVKQAEDATNVQSNLLDAFDRAAKENTILRTGAGFLRTPASVYQIRAMTLPLIHDMEGKISEFEQKTVEDLIPHPGDTDDKIATKRDGLIKFIEQKKSAPTARGYGVNLENFPSTSTNPVTRLDPQKQQWLAWAQANPNDPRSAILKQKLLRGY